jgi:hypothetical protein
MPRELSNWITTYQQYTEDTEAPAHFHLWVGAFAIGAVLGRNTWIDMGTFQWVPNQYLVLVGEPAVVTKSTSIRQAEDLLRETGVVQFGSNSSTWQDLVNQLAKAQQGDIETGIISSPLTLMISELGSFLDMENREQIDFMVDIWDGQRGVWKRSTVGTGEKKIESPCLNMIAATTQVWVRENFKQNMVGGGFSSRMVMLLGKKKKRKIAYPGLQGTGLRQELRGKLIEDLKHINTLRGEFKLTDEAVAWGTDWYDRHIDHPELRKLTGERFQGYYGRKQTHMHKLAMILSASQSDSMIIKKSHLELANAMLLEMENDLGEILENVQASTVYANNKIEVLRVIRLNPKHSKKELYKEVSTLCSGYEFERILTDLLKAGDVRQIVSGSESVYTTEKMKSAIA